MTSARDGGGEDQLAPVIPLFGGKVTRASELEHDVPQDPSRSGAYSMRVSEEKPRSTPNTAQAAPDDFAQRAEEALVRKLRARSLSVSESRQILRGQGMGAAAIDDVIDRFCERGYLDDALLAEHLVISGVERKGQGRVALSRALAQRGITREVIDAALGDLPDDDAERALEFARTKARSLSRLDFDTALRRLMGQLARRGYGGSVAMTAARTALTEASLGGPTTGVRFVDSD